MVGISTGAPGLVLVLLLATLPLSIAGAQDSASAKEPPNLASTALKLKDPIAKDIEADKVWDGRGLVPFKAIDNPKMVKAADAGFMTPNDYVLGVTVDGESRAYPTRFIWFHHVVNYTLTGSHQKNNSGK